MPENKNNAQATPANLTKLQSQDFEREVLCELIRLHATVLLRMPWVQTLLVIGVVMLVFRAVPANCWSLWGLLSIAMECWRARFARQILSPNQPFDLVRTHWRLIGQAAATGAAVGLSAVLFLSRLRLPDQALLVMILFAMPAAGVSVAVSSRQILAAYSLLILAPAAVSWIMLYPEHLITASGLTVLYWCFIIGVAHDGEQLLRRSVAIRRERDRMLLDLEQRNAEVSAAVAKAEQSSRSRARVLAAASHDLRQPLHALSVYSAVLVAQPSLETLPEVAHNMDRLVRNLGGLLHGLLDLSRLSADQYELNRQRVSLDRLVDEICVEFETQAREKQLPLLRKLSHVRLHDDPLVIGRIARNLLDNAIKYTERGHIIIETYCEGNRAILAVADTGKGIPPQEQTSIFEEFYQLSNPNRDFTQGVGLGLAIVQRLCDLIDARIRLTSTPDHGARFEIVFASLTNDNSTGINNVAADMEALRGKTVFLVDDDVSILHAMSMLLKSWGISIHTASAVAEAESLFIDNGKPDLLIADLRLNDQENGMVLAHRLCQIHGAFPVLIISGESAPEPFKAIAADGYRLLQKPIIAENLATKLLALMGGVQVGG